MTSADALKAAAERIDKYHDEMLWNGMPLWMAQQIEDARANGLNVNALLPAGAQIQVPGRLVRVNALLSHVAQQAEVEPGLVKAVAWSELPSSPQRDPTVIRLAFCSTTHTTRRWVRPPCR